MPGPVAGRRQLMEATRANLEPIFLLYDGDGADGAASRLVDAGGRGRPPLMTVDTDDGIRHRLWALTDPAEQAAVAADLAARQALIADGHHRYAAYLQLQARKRANGQDGPGHPAHGAVGRGARAAGGLAGLPASYRRDPPGDPGARRPGGGQLAKAAFSGAAAAGTAPATTPRHHGRAARGRRRGVPGGRRRGGPPAHRPRSAASRGGDAGPLGPLARAVRLGPAGAAARPRLGDPRRREQRPGA